MTSVPGRDDDRDRLTTPSFQMGAFAEYVRRRPDAIRSNHPQISSTAVGPSARAWTATHRLDSHHGEGSPIRAFARDPHVRRSRVGRAAALFFPVREAVDFAVRWMDANRHTDVLAALR